MAPLEPVEFRQSPIGSARRCGAFVARAGAEPAGIEAYRELDRPHQRGWWKNLKGSGGGYGLSLRFASDELHRPCHNDNYQFYGSPEWWNFLV